MTNHTNEEGFVFNLAIASRFSGWMPLLANPAFILGMEKALSKGDFETLENSRFVTTKFFLVKDKVCTAFE